MCCIHKKQLTNIYIICDDNVFFIPHEIKNMATEMAIPLAAWNMNEGSSFSAIHGNHIENRI